MMRSPQLLPLQKHLSPCGVFCSKMAKKKLASPLGLQPLDPDSTGDAWREGRLWHT